MRPSLVLLAMLLGGCVVGDLLEVRRSQKVLAEQSFVGGTVAAADGADTWMVVLIASVPCDEDWSALRDAAGRGEHPSQSADPALRAAFERAREKVQLVSHAMLKHPGRWYSGLAPGCYAVGAFQDLNRDQRYSDEPALPPLHPDRMLELAPGQRVDSLRLVIPRDGRFAVDSLDPVARQTADLAVRSHEDQTFVSLDQVAVEGEVVDLADPKFGEKSGKLGFFDVYEFAWKLGPGVYFLEPYARDKIPVLFVHGAEGYPQLFAKLIEGLDRTRFQPWFFFYPSGARLEAVAHFLTERIARLEDRYGFPKLAVVAHSMGGLVSRAFLLEHHARVDDDPIGLFVSYSTPWEGVASARAGVEKSPVVIDSWRDVAAGSEFIHAIFYQDPDSKLPRDLPESISYHLIFGVEDQTIAVPSAIRWQVVREAENRWPLPYGHVDILDSPEASLLLNEILEAYAD
jgi:Lecithin:cholesterol acyltransferase